MQAFLEGLKRLGPARIAALAAAAIGTLAIIALLVLSGSSPRMALLYGDLDLRDSGQWPISSAARTSHSASNRRRTDLVPADQVAQARVLLAN